MPCSIWDHLELGLTSIRQAKIVWIVHNASWPAAYVIVTVSLLLCIGTLRVGYVRCTCGIWTTGLPESSSSRRRVTMTKSRAAGTPYMSWKF